MSDTKQPYLKWHNENLRIFDANFKIDTLSISIRFGISYVVWWWKRNVNDLFRLICVLFHLTIPNPLCSSSVCVSVDLNNCDLVSLSGV